MIDVEAFALENTVALLAAAILCVLLIGAGWKFDWSVQMEESFGDMLRQLPDKTEVAAQVTSFFYVQSG